MIHRLSQALLPYEHVKGKLTKPQGNYKLKVMGPCNSIHLMNGPEGNS